MYDLIIKNAHVMSMDAHLGVFECAHIAIKGDIIDAIWTDEHACHAHHVIDAKGKLVTPGLIDCHTHLVYAGNRALEFTKRLQGMSYADIAKQGGGILSTVSATREATHDELLQSALSRAKLMLAHGTTMVEIKSGYGLDLDTEMKMLRVARDLSLILPFSVISTFLAHVIPPEYRHDADSYVDEIISVMLPRIKKEHLATFVDVFCETIAFNVEQTKRLFLAAKEHGFMLKLHAEQLSDQQSAVMAAELGACSVDHLEHLKPEDCAKLVNDKTVAVLLPGAFYFLKETTFPPIHALREHQVPIAISTDANPGTSPFLTLPLMMNMACVLFGLSIEEAWQGVTLHAAKALDQEHLRGSLVSGKKADVVIWSCYHPDEIVYNPSVNFCDTVICAGKIVSID
jgi:imidazolonepropionase